MTLSEVESLATAVVVVGAGAAGLRAAIELTQRGVPCLVVSRRGRGDAHSRMAAGGINAALGSLDPEDRWDIHAADTLVEGHHLAQPRAVELLAQRAPDRVRELADWGCRFDRTPDGKIAQRFFGAQTFRRTCYAGDKTGEVILATLVRRAEALGVPVEHGVVVTAVAVEDGRACGVIGIHERSGRPVAIAAGAVLLAGGGYAGAYARTTSRVDENVGDAAALALRAGAALRDMELVQFHPTGHTSPPHLCRELVSEAARGEGGWLRNADGERFMARYSPDRMELDARDVVARAIDAELRAGRGTPGGGVWLDLTHRPAERVRARLPKLVARMMAEGVDVTKSRIEVAPSAHYAMGGVRVDLETGRSDVAGLHVVGEASSGLHGANRLGGNSLAETVVFGQLVGAYLADHVRAEPTLPRHVIDQELARLERLATREGEEDPSVLCAEVGHILWEHAGVLRTASRIDAGLTALEALRERCGRVHVASRPGTPRFGAALSLGHLDAVAEAVLRSALARTESRGAHFREDHPETRPEWRSSVLVTGSPGALALRTEPVPPCSPALEAALHEPHVREYHHLE